ncbi:NADP-dependent oxidoreductase [Streptomyces sp. TRM 70361]|uniref:MDR family NADP-dependent oxidoreductase n=1 Tax=Streptomyces sp. TRM 70361 TaxID=3116553 RepID=UPI002E7ACF19|nr:NADP-dependent oxidoreductase [Streptomyces sp. TRM 70361]MEE1942892.1 NADP-dependent oxidoreductase [Streptomyces sp. TRM 70361]
MTAPSGSSAPPALPRTSREVRLRSLPDGLPAVEHFEVAEVPLPRPGPGEVLVRNRAFLVFAALLRTVIDGHYPGAVLRPGDTLFGPAVGEVVAAPTPGGPSGGGPRPGDTVLHQLGWREYAAVPAGQCTVVGPELPDPVAHLSQGWTAYGALTRAAEVRPGDTVFVTGGAGAVGSLAGQLARLLGAERVIGSTGSPDKARRLVAELGYDAAVVRGAEPVADQLAKAAPDGVDVLLDTVGGEQLRAAVAAARPGARFVLVGGLAAQLAPEGLGGTPPAGVDWVRVVLNRVTLRGFNAADHPDALPEWNRRFGDWLRSGRISFPHTRLAGIESGPRAFREVIEGRRLGAVVVEP